MFEYNEFRDDYAVLDSLGACYGFVWRWQGFWCVGINGHAVEYKKRLKDAKTRASELVANILTTGGVTHE